MTELSERIKQAIDKSGKSQRQIARDAGTTAATINRYISGERMPNAAIIPKLAKACGASIEWLLTGEEQKGKAKELWIPCSNLINDTAGMFMQAQELIEQAYHKGYKAGIEDGRKIATTNTSGYLQVADEESEQIGSFTVTSASYPSGYSQVINAKNDWADIVAAPIAPSIQNTKLTPKEIVNFLIDQFDVTESTARDMWHKLKQLQSWDDCKKGIKED